MASDFLSQLGRQAPHIALAFLAARKGGPMALAALEGGMAEAQQRQEAMSRQAQLDEERRNAQAAQEARAQSAETRASDAAARAEEAARINRVQSSLQYLDQYAQQQAETAPDAAAAENALLGRASSLESMFNVPQGQLSGAIPNMAPAISRRQKKLAEDVYARAEKTYGAEAVANDGITLTVEPFGQVKPSQLRAMFSAPATTATGEPAKPYIKPTDTDKRGFATKDVVVNGKRILAGYDPDTNTYYAPGDMKTPLTGTIQEYSKPDAKAADQAQETAERARLVKAVVANPDLYDRLSARDIADIAPDLAKAGFKGFGKSMNESAVVKIAESRSALSALRDLRATLVQNEQYMGPIAGLAALNPYSDARKAQADIDRVKQRVGKALEGGVLRKEDEEKYKKILAKLRDEPSTAIYKVDQMLEDIQRDMDVFIEEQRAAGRRVGTVNRSGTPDDTGWTDIGNGVRIREKR